MLIGQGSVKLYKGGGEGRRLGSLLSGLTRWDGSRNCEVESNGAGLEACFPGWRGVMGGGVEVAPRRGAM